MQAAATVSAIQDIFLRTRWSATERWATDIAHAFAAARFTLPHAFATGFGMSATSSASSHT